MQVFMTGASGYIGFRVAGLLLSVGHSVIGLARSDEASDRLVRAGVRPARGDLRDPARLHVLASEADAIVHTAFDHDLSRFAEAVQAERTAVMALLEATTDGRTVVISSGTGVLGNTHDRVVDDDDGTDVAGNSRGGVESLALQIASARGVRCAVVRLPLFVHGHGGSVFIPALVRAARQAGVSSYVNEGANRYTAVHVDDAARLCTSGRAGAGRRHPLPC